MWLGISFFIHTSKYSNCKVTGICNSVTQKAHIEEKCRDCQLENVEVIVADISTFDMEASYDRIFPIEMFEHLKNYGDPLKKISIWMKQIVFLLFIIFAIKHFAYHCEDINEDDWMVLWLQKIYSFIFSSSQSQKTLQFFISSGVSVAGVIKKPRIQ